MLRIRLAADLAPFATPFRTSLDQVRSLGLEGVELDLLSLLPLEEFTRTAIREIHRELTDRGLALAATRLRTVRGFDDPTDLERRFTQTRRAMEITYQLGGNITLIRLGTIPQDRESSEYRILQEILADFIRVGDTCGVIPTLELGAASPDDVTALCGSLPSEGIGVDVNPADLAMHGHEPAKAVEALGGWIRCFHATDAAGRPGGGYRIVPLGQGDVDYPAVLSALEAVHYPGYLILRPTGSSDAIEELRRGKEFLYRL